VVDAWASLFCARQVEAGCNRLINSMLIVCHELQEPGKVRDPFHCLLACVSQADGLKQLIMHANFDVDISEKAIFSLSVLIQRLHEFQDGRPATPEAGSAHAPQGRTDALQQPVEGGLAVLALVRMLRDLEDHATQMRMRCEAQLASDELPEPEVGRSSPSSRACTFWLLILGDLHLGASDSPTNWQHILGQFRSDLQIVEEIILRGGRWDLVALVGDLIGEGKSEQFAAINAMLDERWRYWREKKGSEPCLVAVPGNHDLVRPSDSSDARILALDRLYNEPELQKRVFSKGTDYRELIDASFAKFSAWWESQRKRWPGRDPRKGSIRAGELAGEFAATLEKDGGKLGVVGLNSAFLHFGDVEKDQSHLAVCNQQFNAINGPDWCGEQDACILLTHHPADWLQKECRKNFANSICTSKYFALQICGHQHVPYAENSSRYGSGGRGLLINSSLCGRVNFGKKTLRIHGYTVVKIARNDQGEWSYRLFPREASSNLGWKFRRDGRYELEEADGGTREEPIRSSRRP
jgi:hypothetical protein